MLPSFLTNEEEVWIILHSDPKEIDLDLILDTSMLGRYRAEQINRWRKEPRFFLYRDVTAMNSENVLVRRRKEVMKKMIKDFKEGTRGKEED